MYKIKYCYSNFKVKIIFILTNNDKKNSLPIYLMIYYLGFLDSVTLKTLEYPF